MAVEEEGTRRGLGAEEGARIEQGDERHPKEGRRSDLEARRWSRMQVQVCRGPRPIDPEGIAFERKQTKEQDVAVELKIGL